MKKVLFATTALVATAGVAAADVTYGGYGRFGVVYSETAATAAALASSGYAAAKVAADDAASDLEAAEQVVLDAATDLDKSAAITARDTAIDDLKTAQDALADEDAGVEAVAATDSIDLTNRFRLQIDATAESDAGVTFGARVRIQQNTGGTGTGINGVRFFARSGGLEVGVGNIFGGIESMPGMYPIDLGLTGLGYDYTAYNFRGDAYSSDGAGAGAANGVEVMYSAGDLSIHVSASDTNDRIAAHAAYTFSGWTVALGVQDSSDASDTELAFSVGGSVGIADVTLAYADNGTAGDRIVLAGRFDVGAATNVEVYYADDSVLGDGAGIDFNHDLGGGTSVRGGIAQRINGTTQADLGVRFNF